MFFHEEKLRNPFTDEILTAAFSFLPLMIFHAINTGITSSR
jgi:hypothetical protein